MLAGSNAPPADGSPKLEMYAPGGFIEAGLEWPALIRQLERVDGTGYRT